MRHRTYVVTSASAPGGGRFAGRHPSLLCRTNGFLTAVPSFAGSISYHPNTMVNQVAHANGVTDSYGKDPNDMARPLTPRAA